jgi:hypothetical protein
MVLMFFLPGFVKLFEGILSQALHGVETSKNRSCAVFIAAAAIMLGLGCDLDVAFV